MAPASEAQRGAAVSRLQRFVRQRKLRHVWLELIDDLIDWNRLYKQLMAQKQRKAAAASVLQKHARNNPHTSVAVRVAGRNAAPAL